MPKPNLSKLKGASSSKQASISAFFTPSSSSPKSKTKSEQPEDGTFPANTPPPSSSLKREGEPLHEKPQKKQRRSDAAIVHNNGTATLTAGTQHKLEQFQAPEEMDQITSEVHEMAPSSFIRPNALKDIDLDLEDGNMAEVCADTAEAEVKQADTSRENNSLSKFAAKKSAATGSSNTSKAKSKYTPLEQQFMEIKAKHEDTILFVECGYKYRFFGQDAEIAARELNIFCHLDHNFMTASIPTYRLFVHVRRLVAKGHKVGVVKQQETAALKAAGDNRSAPFTRELTALYTKATLIGEDVDPSSSESIGHTASSIMCIYEPETHEQKGKQFQIAIMCVQPSTGDMVYDVFEDESCRVQLETRLAHLQPAELLLPASLSQNTEKLIDQFQAIRSSAQDSIRTERLPSENFSYDSVKPDVIQFLRYHSAEQEDEMAGDSDAHLEHVMQLPKPAFCCYAALLTHLKAFNLHKILALTSELKVYSTRSQYMQLAGSTITNLELLHNLTDGASQGSVFWVINHTKTRFGARMLHEWLTKPLLDISALEERLDAVGELCRSDAPVLQQLSALLKKLPDLEQALATIYHKKCSAHEFVSVCQGLQNVLHGLSSFVDSVDSTVKCGLLRSLLIDLPQLLRDVGQWINAINPVTAKDGDKSNLFMDDTDYPAVSQCKQDIEDVRAEIKDHRKEVRLALRMPAIDYVTVSGTEFLVEVKNSQLKLVPSDWVKISGTKTVSRYHTPTIVKLLKRLSQLREQVIIEVNSAWQEFLVKFEEVYPRYRLAVRHLATVDCLSSLSELAKQEGYTRPEFVEGTSCIKIKEGRHPVVETLLGDQAQYMPNDTHLQADGQRCMLITGPNMGGKSCYIKQVAIINILAQMGSYVPAASASIGIVDAIYTRMGASDELFKGRSTFMVELSQAADIMKHATQRSLVVLDELGRGTSTHDGVAIAAATLNYFVSEVKCLTLFVTHYPPVAEVAGDLPHHITNYHMSFLLHDRSTVEDDVDKHANSITFLYQLVEGMAKRSYGLNVAQLANLPEEIVHKASEKSHELERSVEQRRTLRSLFAKLLAGKEGENREIVDKVANLLT